MVLVASKVRKKYKISYYDSLIFSAGLKTNTTVLYSEDIHNGLVVNEQLKIINPFKDL